jgi:hypothetical protein
MILSLTKMDLTAASISVAAIIKIGEMKKDLKPNSSEFAILQANREIQEKLDYAGNLLNKKEMLGVEHPEVDIEFNRPQTKVLIATMVHTAAVQSKVLGEYEKRAENHESFADEPGRRKKDYMVRLNERMNEVNGVISKLRKAL